MFVYVTPSQLLFDILEWYPIGWVCKENARSLIFYIFKISSILISIFNFANVYISTMVWRIQFINR